MRLLLDECMPKPLKRALTGHEVRTVQEMGWAGTRNGALLQLATTRFDGLTVDQGVEHQLDVTELSISVVILVAVRTSLPRWFYLHVLNRGTLGVRSTVDRL